MWWVDKLGKRGWVGRIRNWSLKRLVLSGLQAASRRTKMGTKAPSVYLVDKFTGEAAIVIDACW